MKYMGSKNRYAKYILPIILKDRVEWYVEPFCGGCNLIDKVDGHRIANDNNYYLIEMFKAIQTGWEPPQDVSEQEYYDIHINPANYPPYLVGFVSIGCSYSGKEWGGYARGDTNDGKPRNYAAESKRNILKQAKKLKDVIFTCGDYHKLDIPPKSIVYCDPPYEGTTKYKTGGFDYNRFWDWVRMLSHDGHKVFVSEYKAPDDFKVLWSKKVNNTLDKDTGSKHGVECLFQLKD
jgi:DNA adenine methylase